MVENLGLSYCNTRELNRTIDEEIPERPKFKCEEVQLGGVVYEFHFREIIPCLRALFGDARFSDHLKFAPECHYKDVGHTVQAFGEMYTGKWWWSMRVCFDPYVFFRYSMFPGIAGVTQTGCYCDAGHCLIGQDAACAFSIQVRLPDLRDNQ